MTKSNRQNKVRASKIMLLLLMLLRTYASDAQTDTLTLSECYQKARAQYPLIQQKSLLEAQQKYTLQNLDKANLPQLAVYGQATYQSDVTQIPIQIPNHMIEPPAKDQYKIYAELVQNLYDGGTLKTQKELEIWSSKIAKEQWEIQMYALRERINQLYLGVLLTQAQIKQGLILQQDIQLGQDKIQAAIQYGTALPGQADVLRAEWLSTEQRLMEMRANRTAIIEMLSVMIGDSISESTHFQSPPSMDTSNDIHRRELTVWHYQTQQVEIQKELLEAQNRPKLQLFAQGGAGRPALNMLSNQFEPFYYTGVRLQLPFSGLYTAPKRRALYDIQKKQLGLQQETFVHNLRTELKKENADIKKYRQLMSTDEELITLHTRIKETALAQLGQGVITSQDYIKEAHAVDRARQNQIIHRIQWLMAQYARETTLGN